ncbi:MAG: Uncharacterized protein FD123_1988 [Bacteroidetes bacterium]|nr:MAG: Uncharacterized protein FD123_1988 [Bacteroidota bacterium]
MKRIGLIGESENDRDSLKKLLEKKYGDRVQFIPMLKRIEGYQLDTEKTLFILEEEYLKRKPDAIVFQRDLDAHEGNLAKLKERNEYFDQSNKHVSGSGLFLLHIHEIEALILADLDGFNKRYAVSVSFTGNPMYQDNPKEWLKSKSGRNGYEPKHCAVLFENLDFDRLRQRVRYFDTFINQFDQLLTA